ncbi:glycosyltransferase [Rhodopirellula sp. JC639]|uniref:glycosyltransferase n=1 Tax=Stieleria mannarensis TaxID=2755585 RepID=UPI0015FEC3A4|nr:glycosyltransferase [Rhodopirellula sp. JC639]
MKVVMFTNTFTPHVGGVCRSVQQFTQEFRALGHRVLIVAPEFEGAPADETGVVRIPALQHFNGSDFSVPVPIPGYLTTRLDQFQPDLVHSHHPFLLGGTALRVSARRDIPVVFTHHTQYEKYTHYVPGDSKTMQRFVVELAVGYCNLCDAVIAPGKTILERLREQGVTRPMVEIPTGVDVVRFRHGDGPAARKRLGIDEGSFVIGHVGRLAPEKGLECLANCVARFVQQFPDATFVVAGEGPSGKTVRGVFEKHGVSDRLKLLGNLPRNDLVDLYHAMDVFAFSSQSETQAMVITEAMAASVPIVAVDAAGVRDVVRDGENGRLVKSPLASPVAGALADDQVSERFLDALIQVHDAPHDRYRQWTAGAWQTAQRFSMEEMAARTIKLYEQVANSKRDGEHRHDAWSAAIRRIEEEWQIWSNVVDAAGHAIIGKDIHVF